MALIEVDELTKTFRIFRRREGLRGAVQDLFRRRYQSVNAVDGVSFQIERGERVGYIGANGAGKSTTVKMLTGILTPTSGRIRVGGLVPHIDRERYVRRIGVVFGQRSGLWWDLAVAESFRLLAKIYGVSQGDYDTRLARLGEVLGIGEYLHTPVRKLSLGQKMRCELAAALLHGPEMLFLDEPTIGLDVVAKQAIRQFLNELNREQGTTLLLTTHDLGDIEELCDRVMIIHQGRLLYDGPLDTLRTRLGDRVVLNFTIPHPPDAQRVSALEIPGVEWSANARSIDPAPGATDGNRARGSGSGLAPRSDGPAGVVSACFRRDEVSRAEVIRRVLDAVPVDDISMEEMPIDRIVQTIFGEGTVGDAVPAVAAKVAAASGHTESAGR